jgi:hypothetical protein
MFSFVGTHVDQFRSFCDATNSGVNDALRYTNKCDNGSIVVWVDVSIENTGAVHGGYRISNSSHNFRPPAFTEVWNTLDET